MPYPLPACRDHGSVSGAAGGTVAVTTLSDTFTGTDGTALSAHTMNVGGGWTNQSGTNEIGTNKATPNGASALPTLSTADAGSANVTISAKLTSGGVNDGALIARFTNTSNYWKLAINDTGNTLTLYEFNAGVGTQRAQASVTINTGTEYTVQLVCSGTNLTGTVNGANSITYSSSFNQTATKHGIYFDNTGQTADDFLVTSP